jgi:hypothetical protein
VDVCAVLLLQDAAEPGQGTCDPSRGGTAVGLITTWGGLPVQDERTGWWHVHVAEMANHCGMCAWGSQSQVAHYRSREGVLGPYQRVDTSIGAFAHNPVVVRTPGSAQDPPVYLLFHIGLGCASQPKASHPCNYTRLPACTNGTTPPGPPHYPHDPVPAPANLTFSHLHVASSLDGPWDPAPSHWTVPYCANNPAPLFLANGSLLIACHSAFSGMGPCPSSSLLYLAVSVTADWMTGPYHVSCLNLTNPRHTVNGTTYTAANEDPHLYRDTRGALHMLTHNQSPCYQNASFYGADVRGCGGHFFSDDNGSSWTFTWEHAAYNGTVRYTDGMVHRYKRERPKVVQDATGNIVALSTGIGIELLDAFEPGNDCACTLVVGVGQA